MAKIRRRLPSTAIGGEAFQTGSPESDILHEILKAAVSGRLSPREGAIW
ncbi:hypothetical protein [Bradyrhizobium ottawaense]|nr:hypothetical protein [Bradyrhizobium ottawaense]